MQYQRSMEIEQRLNLVLRLIQEGGFSTPMIASKLGVSIPTVSRCVTALRERGHDIRSQKHGNHWQYQLVADLPEQKRDARKPALSEVRP